MSGAEKLAKVLLTPAARMAMVLRRQAHTTGPNWGDHCGVCLERWPCSAIEALKAWDEERADLHRFGDGGTR